MRGPGRGFVYRFGRYVGLPPARLDRAAAALQARGARAVAIARITPGLRAAAPVAAGLAGLSFRTFLAGILAGSLIWILFHTLLGFFAGPIVLATLQSLRLPVIPVAIAILGIGLAAWLLLGRARRRGAEPTGSLLDRLRAWTEAGCPACVIAGALTTGAESRGLSPEPDLPDHPSAWSPPI